MKQCNTCHESKPLEEYAWKSKRDEKRSGKCKSCQRIYSSEHYSGNKESYNARARLNQAKARVDGRAFMIDYLGSHPCVDCGQSDIRVLQFDHKDLIGSGRRVGYYTYSLPRLKKEIAKCEVRCANCHMIRTFEQMGWDRLVQ